MHPHRHSKQRPPLCSSGYACNCHSCVCQCCATSPPLSAAAAAHCSRTLSDTRRRGNSQSNVDERLSAAHAAEGAEGNKSHACRRRSDGARVSRGGRHSSVTHFNSKLTLPHNPALSPSPSLPLSTRGDAGIRLLLTSYGCGRPVLCTSVAACSLSLPLSRRSPCAASFSLLCCCHCCSLVQSPLVHTVTLTLTRPMRSLRPCPMAFPAPWDSTSASD
jgi:hypothetical protein